MQCYAMLCNAMQCYAILCNVVRWEWLGFLRELEHSSNRQTGRAIRQQVGMPRYVCLHPSFATWMAIQLDQLGVLQGISLYFRHI